MKKNTLLAVLLLIGTIASSQNKSIYAPMKPISQTEITMTEYDKDTDAEAVVLYDYGESCFSPSTRGFKVVFERTTRIKILKESGIDWSDIEIPFYTGSGHEEEIKEITGVTYNFENGSPLTTQLDKKQTYVEVHNKYWSALKVPMPNVKVGSIVEIHYRTETKSKYHLHDWEFQWDIPVIHSEYQVSLTPFYIYKWILQGANKFDSKKTQKHSGLEKSIVGVNYREMTHNYVMKDVPAFKDADFITTRDDYIIKMDWQLIKHIDLYGVEQEIMSSWEKIIKEFGKDEYFGKYISKAKKKAGKLIDIAKIGNDSDTEKINQVLNYVKQNYKWNNIHSKTSSKSLNSFLSNKEGVAGDLNLFTIGLLRSVGIEAHGLLISTRKNGRIYYDYPFTHFFNYVLIYAKVDGEIVLLDATDPYVSNWAIPSKCINGKGLLIHDGEVTWIPIDSKTESEKTTNLNIHISDEEVFTEVKLDYTGHLATNKRKKVTKETFDPLEDLMENDGVIEESVEIENLENPEEKLSIRFDVSRESPLGHDKIYFSPFFDEVMTENPLKEKGRKFSIDFTFSRKINYKSSIEIPDGYTVDYVLDDFTPIDNDYFKMDFETTQTDEKVDIEFSYWFKKGKYPNTGYDRLKFYFKEIIKLGQEKVVFKKKE